MLVIVAVSTDYSVGMTSGLGTFKYPAGHLGCAYRLFCGNDQWTGSFYIILLVILAVPTDYSVGMTSGLKTEK